MLALVIDDSSAVRRLIARFLGTLGFDVREARDGLEGLDALEVSPPPSLVLVDWNMPELDGIGFLRRMRADERYGEVPVVMVTTEFDQSRVREALEAGASEYVMK